MKNKIKSNSFQSQRKDILSLLSSVPVKNFFLNTRNISPGEYPYQNYIGFNLTEDRIINCKIYTSYFRRLNHHEIDKFLPTTDSFWNYYSQWEPSHFRNASQTGCSFAVKVSTNQEPIYQFHYRIPITEKLLDNLGIYKNEMNLSKGSLNYGHSLEYQGKNILNKRYFYLYKTEEKRIIARKFIEPACFDAYLLEYTKTDINEKVILWFDNLKYCYQYFHNVGWELLDGLINWMDSLGCVPMFPGLYANGKIRAIYFFKFPHLCNFPFADIRNFQVDTIGNLSCFIK